MAIPIVKPALPDEYLVDNRVYTSQRVFELEEERIFSRVWNFVCHESELANSGDYLTTSVAGQPIILCRDGEGALRGFYNTCRHRASQVVMQTCGHDTAFTCLYHLWTYALDGTLLGVPEAEAYVTSYNPGGLDKSQFGLVPVRVESMHRLVFVCLDDETPSLAAFLGESAETLARPFAGSNVKAEVVWSKVLRANWKMQAENSRDGYHATLLHQRLRGVSPPRPYRLFDAGHAVQLMGLDYDRGRELGTLDGTLAEEPELAKEFMAHPLPGLTKEEPAYVVTAFPDTLFVLRYSTGLIERQVPLSAEETLVEARQLYLGDDMPEQRDVRDKHWRLYWAWDSGNLAEDWEAWEAQQRGVKSRAVRYSLLARGEPASEGLRGDDNRVRSFWAEWRRYMRASANAPPDGV